MVGRVSDGWAWTVGERGQFHLCEWQASIPAIHANGVSCTSTAHASGAVHAVTSMAQLQMGCGSIMGCSPGVGDLWYSSFLNFRKFTLETWGLMDYKKTCKLKRDFHKSFYIGWYSLNFYIYTGTGLPQWRKLQFLINPCATPENCLPGRSEADI